MRKKLSLILAVLLLFSVSMSADVLHAESLNDVKGKMNELDRKNAELQKKSNTLHSNKANTEKKIDENLNKQSTNKSEMEVIDDKLADTKTSIVKKENEISQTTEKINSLTEEVKNLKKQIRNLHEEISQLQKSIIEREALLKNRLRSIQESGGEMSYLEVLLGAKSFSDFISRTSAVNTIMDSDKIIMEELDADKRAMEAKKVEVEQKKVQVEENKKEVEARKAELDKQKKQLNELKSKLDAQLSKKEKLQRKLEKEHGELEEYKVSLEEEQMILKSQEAALAKAKQLAQQQQKQLEQQEAQRQKEAQQQKSIKSSNKPSGQGSSSKTVKPTGNGVFIQPAKGYLTDGFGTRGGTHFGIDIGNSIAKNGGDVNVHAAASGVVTASYYSSSYGNVVFITHFIKGTQYETVYAHMKDTPLVKQGQAVTQGQQIGVIGNTGDSFGPHLHFEIHQPSWNNSKSNAVNPLKYISY